MIPIAQGSSFHTLNTIFAVHDATLTSRRITLCQTSAVQVIIPCALPDIYSTNSAFQPLFFLSPGSLLSLFPPLSISKCPAFCASIFSVLPTSPELLLCLILFCVMMDAFLGLMTRAPVCLRATEDLEFRC